MATEKKHNERFCLQFDAGDPQQKQVSQLLNTMARGEKTAFITRAVLHYLSCHETPKTEVLLPRPEDAIYVITESQLDSLIHAVVGRIEIPDKLDRLPDTEDKDDANRDTAILNAASIFNF